MVEDRVTSTLRERQQQEDIALNVRIGGLKSDWKGEGDLNHESFVHIQSAIPMVQCDPATITSLTHEPRTNNAIYTFKTNADRIKFLEQSRLLKDTKIWFAEDLTSAQLKQNYKRCEKRAQQENGQSAEEVKPLFKSFELPNQLPSHPPMYRFYSSYFISPSFWTFSP
ncbi:hypothetical protein GOP47_0029647 [Adiantum capillus-veneris]|nr:hypothetical protein GOP47_0029647 [Adiantum capillus-veneris]